MFLVQRQMQQEMQRLTINTIAVVNMDEGVLSGEQYINYGSEFLKYPDVNFVTVGLEEARQGLENDSYAAYILIPSEFSKNVLSLNDIPDSASIEYAVNPNLRNDVYGEVMADISLFTSNLNDNIEYMYLNAILMEFHEAQDIATQIMENDTTDMELLLAIENEAITHHIALTEVTMPEYNLSAMDLSPYQTSVQNMIGEISSLYAGYANSGQQAFLSIAQSGNNLATQLGGVGELMKKVDFAKDSNGNDITAGGVASVNQYVEGVATVNAETISRITMGINDYQALIDTEVTQMFRDEVAQALSSGVNQYNQNMLTRIEAEANALIAIIGELENPESLEEADYERINGEVEEILERIQEIKGSSFTLDESEINTMADRLAASTTAGMQAIVDDMKTIQYPDAGELGVIITNEILVPIQNNQSRIAGEIESAVSNATLLLQSYQSSVQGFDVYDYVNETEVNGVISAIGHELADMQSTIQMQDSEYRSFIYEVYRSENENLQNWRADILEADALSAEKLEQGLEAAKESRSNSNRNNVEMLYALTQKLPYTRIGSMEFTDAYEFIVTPLETKDVGKRQRVTLFDANNEYQKYIVYILVFMLCMRLSQTAYRAFYRWHKMRGQSSMA